MDSSPLHLPGRRVGGISVRWNAVEVLYWVCSRRRFKKSLQSAALHASVVDEYLQEEVAAGRVIDPLPQEVAPVLWISRFGVIPKSQPGKWWLIVDLSSPEGRSVNDAIAKELCSTQYTSAAEAVRRCALLGRGASLVKLDIKSAYRIVGVHPADRAFLGLKWRGEFYVDTVLPFGLRSAPVIFSALADTPYRRGITSGVHYLDDFLFFGRPGTSDGLRNKEVALQVFAELGVPVAAEKLEGPVPVSADLFGH